MRRTFFHNLVFLFLLNLIIKPIWVLGIDRGVQNITGSEAYGLYFSLSALSMLFNILIDMGMTYYNNRKIAQRPSAIKSLAPHILLLKGVLTVIYIALTFLIATLTKLPSASYPLLIMLCVNQVLLSLIIYLRSNISGLHHFKTDSLLSITDKVLMLLLFGTILTIPSLREGFNIRWFVYGQTVCYAAALLIAFAASFRYLKHIQLHISVSHLKVIWQNSYPYVLVIFFMTLYTRSDAVLLERLSGAEVAGNYAAAYRLLDAANQFGYLFAALLLPIFSRMLGNKVSIQALLQSAFIMIMLLATLGVGVAYMHGDRVMSLLYHNTVCDSGKTLTVLMMSLWGSFGVYVFGTLLAAAAKLKALNIITGIAATGNIALNLILIPQLGMSGAAWSAFICTVFVAAAEYAYIKRTLKEQISNSVWIRLLVIGGCTFGYAFIIKNYLASEWLLKSFLLILAIVLTSFVLRLVSIQQVKQMLQLVRQK